MNALTPAILKKYCFDVVRFDVDGNVLANGVPHSVSDMGKLIEFCMIEQYPPDLPMPVIIGMAAQRDLVKAAQHYPDCQTVCIKIGNLEYEADDNAETLAALVAAGITVQVHA